MGAHQNEQESVITQLNSLRRNYQGSNVMIVSLAEVRHGFTDLSSFSPLGGITIFAYNRGF